MRRLLTVLLLAALPCFGQSAAPLSGSAGTLSERSLNDTQSGLGFTRAYPPVLSTVSVTALSTPGAPTVTPTGGTATTWGYKIVAKIQNGAHTAAGSAGTTAAGADTLDATHYNTVTWSAVTGAYAYDVYRTTAGTSPSTTGLIGTVYAPTVSLVDNGLAGDSATAPTSNTTGVISGAASSVLTVTAYTADQALAAAQSGAVISNAGAGGPVVIDLPTGAVTGVTFKVLVAAAQLLYLKPGTGQTLRRQASVATNGGGSNCLNSATVGTSLDFTATSATTWVAIGGLGSWTAGACP